MSRQPILQPSFHTVCLTFATKNVFDGFLWHSHQMAAGDTTVGPRPYCAATGRGQLGRIPDRAIGPAQAAVTRSMESRHARESRGVPGRGGRAQAGRFRTRFQKSQAVNPAGRRELADKGSFAGQVAAAILRSAAIDLGRLPRWFHRQRDLLQSSLRSQCAKEGRVSWSRYS
jgi:hypothetical protein